MRKKGLFMMVSIFVLALSLFLILWGGTFVAAADQESGLHRIQRTGVMRCGWALWYPWCFVDEKTKKISGIGPDVLEELAKELGNVKIEWVADNWATIAAGLQAGKFDIAFPYAVSLSRAMACDFTDDTMREAQTFSIKKKDATRFKTVKDLDQPGIKISVSIGSASEIVLTKVYKKPEIIRFKSSPDAMMAFVLGKVDAYANTGSAIAATMKEYPDTTVVKGHYALGKNAMAVRQGDQIFLNWLNLFIADMKETGRLDSIFEKYGSKREVFFD